MTSAAALIPSWAFYAVPWALALLVAVLGARRIGPLRGLGLGLMTVPVWETLLGIIDSFGPLLQGGLVLRAYSTYQLSGLYSYKLVSDLGYLGAGFLLFAGGPKFLAETPRTLARKLVALGFPMGGRSEGHAAFIGLLGFPLLLLGTVGVNLLTQGLDVLRQSDESSVFANMTLYHAVLISLAAAFGEELLYRGLVQTALARRMPILLAIAVQAVFFGFAHSGYATWIHVLLPTLFGVVAGVAAWRFGIWSAIVLHLVVDLYAFFAEAAANQPWLWTVLNIAFLANILLSAAWGIAWLVKRFQGRPAIQG